MYRIPLACILYTIILTQVGCYSMRGSNGGAQIKQIPKRTVQAADIALPPGYTIEPIVSGLTYPSAIAFDDKNQLYAIETGYAYGEVWEAPKLLRIDDNGSIKVVAAGDKNGPWNGIAWHNGAFYVSEGGAADGGRILRITTDGSITPLISNLPSVGDHHTNGPVIKDGFIYFGVGVATNSGVVGTDNAEFGWLKRKPTFHDLPCKDIYLSGQDYTTPNPLTDDANDQSTTGAYVPFGTTAGSCCNTFFTSSLPGTLNSSLFQIGLPAEKSGKPYHIPSLISHSTSPAPHTGRLPRSSYAFSDTNNRPSGANARP